jgi:hypothetical protein
MVHATSTKRTHPFSTNMFIEFMRRDDFKVLNSASACSPGRSCKLSLPSIARLKNGSCASQAVDIWFVCVSDCRTVEIALEFHFVTYKTYWSSGRLTMT